MTRKHADYIYRNQRDTLRLRVHRRQSGRWDYDVFYPSGKITTYSDQAGDDFATKRAALAEASVQHGPLFAIAVEGNVTDAAWYRKHRGPQRDHAPRKKTSAQLDREIAVATARAAEQKLAAIARTRRPTEAETQEALKAYAAAAAATRDAGDKGSNV